MRRLRGSSLCFALVIAAVVASLTGCSFFHDSPPGASCNSSIDCLGGRDPNGAEKCENGLCVPNLDAGPLPDADTTDADTTDADTTDADTTDADTTDADTTDAGAPDA